MIQTEIVRLQSTLNLKASASYGHGLIAATTEKQGLMAGIKKAPESYQALISLTLNNFIIEEITLLQPAALLLHQHPCVTES